MSFLLNSVQFVNGFLSAYGSERVFFHLIESLLSISLYKTLYNALSCKVFFSSGRILSAYLNQRETSVQMYTESPTKL